MIIAIFKKNIKYKWIKLVFLLLGFFILLLFPCLTQLLATFANVNNNIWGHECLQLLLCGPEAQKFENHCCKQ